MIIKEFVEAYKAKKFMNTPQGLAEKAEWLRSELGIKNYIPFMEKRRIAETIVEKYTDVVDGIKKYDSIGAYIGFVSEMIKAHTSLEFCEDLITDYDLLMESGLLPQIIAEFQESHGECEAVLKMALAMKLEDNNVNVLIGHFLNRILEILDGLVEVAKDQFDGFDLQSILGNNFKEEDLAKLSSLLKYI